MDNTINTTIIEKVTIKHAAIYKAISMLSPLETKDLWAEKNLTEHQSSCENKSVSEISDTTNDTKMPSTQNDWRDITDPKLRKKMRRKAWREVNKDKINLKRRIYHTKNKEKENLRNKSYRVKHKEEIRLQRKSYRKANKDKIKSYQKDWAVANKERLCLKNKAYYEDNKETLLLKCKVYRNRDSVKKQRNERLRLKRKNDIQYRLSFMLRKRLTTAIRNHQKSGSAVNDLGCSIPELKSYLESKFQPGMTWDNHGQHGWHIDHIKPLASFDLTDRKQLLEACHYTNLQPLWCQDNLSKGDRV